MLGLSPPRSFSFNVQEGWSTDHGIPVGPLTTCAGDKRGYNPPSRLTEQIAEYENAAHDYVQDGVRLLELAKKAYFLFKQQNSSEKRKLLNFVCSNSTWKDQTLTATFRQPFDLLALTNTTWQRKKATGNSSSDPCPEWRRGQDSNLHSLSAGGFQDRCTTIMRPLRARRTIT